MKRAFISYMVGGLVVIGVGAATRQAQPKPRA